MRKCTQASVRPWFPSHLMESDGLIASDLQSNDGSFDTLCSHFQEIISKETNAGKNEALYLWKSCDMAHFAFGFEDHCTVKEVQHVKEAFICTFFKKKSIGNEELLRTLGLFCDCGACYPLHGIF